MSKFLIWLGRLCVSLTSFKYECGLSACAVFPSFLRFSLPLNMFLIDPDMFGHF